VAQTQDAVAVPARLGIRVEGVVQGVGFRPFVHGLARSLDLTGRVVNDAAGVSIEVQGAPDRLARFLERLPLEAPPAAVVETVSVDTLPLADDAAFVIGPSIVSAGHTALVTPDIATCEACRREVLDPTARRYRYPFTSCSACGPRFTIARDVPYDRAATTMAAFAMCGDCAREYADPADRRFHAEPIACPACGPRLRLHDADGRTLDGDPLARAAAAIRAGRIVAVKGLGGYHLAVAAQDEAAVARLRSRKHREEKPFAVMAAGLDSARTLVEVDATAAELLTGVERPIVLLRHRPGAGLAASVAPGNAWLGVMLPYTPLHHLLLHEVGAPIVLTSGNRSDEPIAYRDAEAGERLRDIADLWLTHDRSIHIRTDDSVVRVVAAAPQLVRRARGYAPRPITLPWVLPRAVLACGAELKSTVCLARGRHAFLSHHLGDLEHYETFAAFTQAIEHLGRLFDVTPEVIAHDLHPEYLSTKWARERGERLVGVQHHHAHVAACLADNGETGPVIGVALDGLGYGTDGTLWGGEFLVADLAAFTRVGHLATVPMPGGSAAIREPWRMAAAYLHRAFEGGEIALGVHARHVGVWRAVVELGGAHAPLTSSAGRLFDAVAAILDVRDRVSYEGQAAIELEQLAGDLPATPYPIEIRLVGDGFELDGAGLIRAVAADVIAGTGRALIAARFHESLAEAIVGGCRAARERSGLDAVALSGGVFQNARLLARAIERLDGEGFRVLRHRRVPPNDGGVSLGQAVVAARVA